MPEYRDSLTLEIDPYPGYTLARRQDYPALARYPVADTRVRLTYLAPPEQVLPVGLAALMLGKVAEIVAAHSDEVGDLLRAEVWVNKDPVAWTNYLLVLYARSPEAPRRGPWLIVIGLIAAALLVWGIKQVAEVVEDGSWPLKAAALGVGAGGLALLLIVALPLLGRGKGSHGKD